MIQGILDEAKRIEPNSVLNRERLIALDFGVGDGGEFRNLGLQVEHLFAIDTSAPMIQLAQEEFTELKFVGLVGGAEMISRIDRQLDFVSCINTIGYLSEKEEEEFWESISQRMEPDGLVLVVTGNKLFDLFALNSGTAQFFEEELGVEGVERLLVRGAENRFKNARRKNPLTIGQEVQRFGFRNIIDGYCMWHTVPPELLLVNQEMTLRDARWQSRDFEVHSQAVSQDKRWQSLFRCSVFGFVAKKV